MCVDFNKTISCVLPRVQAVMLGKCTDSYLHTMPCARAGVEGHGHRGKATNLAQFDNREHALATISSNRHACTCANQTRGQAGMAWRRRGSWHGGGGLAPRPLATVGYARWPCPTRVATAQAWPCSAGLSAQIWIRQRCRWWRGVEGAVCRLCRRWYCCCWRCNKKRGFFASDPALGFA